MELSWGWRWKWLYFIVIQKNIFVLTCLPIGKANDGNIDCLGTTDEPTFCGTTIEAVPSMSTDLLYESNQTIMSSRQSIMQWT